jgi:hypothetical protein
MSNTNKETREESKILKVNQTEIETKNVNLNSKKKKKKKKM